MVHTTPLNYGKITTVFLFFLLNAKYTSKNNVLETDLHAAFTWVNTTNDKKMDSAFSLHIILLRVL